MSGMTGPEPIAGSPAETSPSVPLESIRNRRIALLVPCLSEEGTIEKGIRDFRREPPGPAVYMQTQEPVRCLPAGLVWKAAEGDAPLKEIRWRDFAESEIRKFRAPLEKILITEYFHRRAVYHESRGENE
jgi:hypothetical protein